MQTLTWAMFFDVGLQSKANILPTISFLRFNKVVDPWMSLEVTLYNINYYFIL